MSKKPSYVQNFERPPGTEIKEINRNWYLYERRTVYNPLTRKKRKKSGRILGAIKPQGFVPSRRRPRLADADSEADGPDGDAPPRADAPPSKTPDPRPPA